MADQACQDYITSLSSAFVLTLATAIFNSIFSVVAIVGNITVLTAIRQTPSMQKPSFILLSGLAVADLGVGLVVQPSFTVIHILITTKHFDHICSLVTFYNISSSFLSGISVATVAALSMERFLALKLNLRYEEIVTMKKTKTALVLIWISVGCLTSSWLKSFQTYLVVACAFLSICSGLICFAYVRIYLVVRQQKARIQDQLRHNQPKFAEEIKTAFATFILVIVFTLCSAPYMCVMIITQILQPQGVHWLALNCSVSLILVNSSINPMLYCWRNKKMRGAVKNVLRHFGDVLKRNL